MDLRVGLARGAPIAFACGAVRCQGVAYGVCASEEDEVMTQHTSLGATECGSGTQVLQRGSFDMYCVIDQVQQFSWTRETRSCPIENT